MIKYKHHKETIHNFIWRSLQIFGKQGVTFLIFILCAKFLTPYDFGMYNYILAIIFLLIMFGDLGISTATSKYVAEYNITDKNKLKSILFSSGILILGLTAIITILTLIIGPSYLGDKFDYVLYLIPLIFIAPMISLYDGIYRGLKRFKELAIISVCVGLVSLSFVYILIKSYGLTGALLAQNIFYLLLLLSLAISYGKFNLKLNMGVIKKIGRYSFFVGLSSVGYFLYTRVDIIVLGYFGFIEEIGYYEIINKFFQILILPVSILATVVAPNTTKNFALKKYGYIKSKLIKESIYLFIIGLFITIFCYMLFPFIFKWFLPNYDMKLFRTMLVIILILVPLRFFSTYISIGYITPSGRVSIIAKYLIIFGIINLILNFILINMFGFIGVIYATLISQILLIIFKDFISFIPWVFKNDRK